MLFPRHSFFSLATSKPKPLKLAEPLDTQHPIEEETLPDYRASNFFQVRPNDIINGRYHVLAKLGFGGSSTVWLARDHASWVWFRKPFVILKVLTSESSEYPEHNMEMRVSAMIRRTKSKHEGANNLRVIREHFDIDGPQGRHTVLVYEPMRETVSRFQQRCNDSRLPEKLAKVLVRYFLEGLDFLHTECHIIHTDLKPDNLMFGIESSAVLDEIVQHETESPAPYKVVGDRFIYCSRSLGQIRRAPGTPKIADFGLAVFDDGRPFNHPIQPAAYRAPEAIIGADWSYSADIWNLGIFELLENRTLFTAKNEAGRYWGPAHLEEMIRFLGPPPQELLDRGRTTSLYFGAEGLLPTDSRLPNDRQSLEDTVTFTTDSDRRKQFLSFARRMIAWLPEKRATAAQLLQDPWLDEVRR